eukprot:PhM_4_TR10331/c0_g1_i1/m.36465/K03239/EIF2B1; translation initiation factor eIF-2B subunit alpha
MLTASVPAFDVPVEDMINVLKEMQTVIAQSAATTHHQFNEVLRPIVTSIKYRHVRSGCEIAERNLERELERIQSAEPLCTDVAAALAKSCDTYIDQLKNNSTKICGHLKPFLQRADAILVHGFSRVIGDALVAASGHRRLTVYITECAPHGLGQKLVNYVREKQKQKQCAASPQVEDGGLALKLIPDTSVAAMLAHVNFVLSGATAVTMNGGIVNTVGTLQTAILAKALGRDFFVVTETFKFTRSFPLRTADIKTVPMPDDDDGSDVTPTSEEGRERALTSALSFVVRRKVRSVDVPRVDLTSPDLIKMLFTEVGVFPPSTAGDELYNAFQGGHSGHSAVV